MKTPPPRSASELMDALMPHTKANYRAALESIRDHLADIKLGSATVTQRQSMESVWLNLGAISHAVHEALEPGSGLETRKGL